MATRCIRCRVLEVSRGDDWPAEGRVKVRDLLPWADPYISSLVQRLKESHDAEWTEFANPRGDDFDWPTAEWGTAEWEDDAFMPRGEESSWAREERPVFGGFPLLDDAE